MISEIDYVNEIMRLLIIGFLSISCAIIIISNISECEVIKVDSKGSGDYLSIHEALDNATDGDIIQVFNGTYNESLQINKSISVLGNGKNDTILINDNGKNGITIMADGVVISGFTIKHSGSFDLKYGISIESNFSQVHNNQFSDYYIGIFVGYGKERVKIHNNSFNNNLGVGISLLSTSDSIIENNLIYGSTSGISLWNCTKIHIKNNYLSLNNYAGILFEDSHNNTIQFNDIVENRVGIRLISSYHHNLKPSSNITFSNNSIYNNSESGVNALKNEDEFFDARFNYWGNNNGPFHIKFNQKGSGDNVTDGVAFIPWYDQQRNIVYLPEKDDGDDNKYLIYPMLIFTITIIIIFIKKKNN